MRKSIALAATGLVTLGLAAGPSAAFAGTASGTMAVTTTVLASATVAAVAPVFATYDPTGATATSETTPGTVTVIATGGTPYSVSMASGNLSGTQFRMADGLGDFLNYNLYQDSGHATLWNGTSTKSSTGLGVAQVFNVYGQIPANQSSPSGVYTDTVTVTATF